MRQKCAPYIVVNQELYRRSSSHSLLKCVTKTHVDYILKEIHRRICALQEKVKFPT